MTTPHSAHDRADDGRLLTVDDLVLHFAGGAGTVRAVDDVSLEVNRGECVGIVGESGSGKSMLARSLVRLLPPVDLVRFSGSVTLEGTDIAGLDQHGARVPRKNLERVRRRGLSMVFQEPLSHLNPTMRIGRQIAEGLPDDIVGEERQRHVLDLLARVELPRGVGIERRYPHELSGGMRQRVMIALALATQPKVLVADEPTTGLDVTVQAQILNMLDRLHTREAMALILITHDLGIVARMCDRVYVMYAGHMVEQGTTMEVFEHPRHPYTKALLDSRPGVRRSPSGRLHRLQGSVPDLSRIPEGCRFRDRCQYAQPRCQSSPTFDWLSPTVRVRCPVLPDMGGSQPIAEQVIAHADE